MQRFYIKKNRPPPNDISTLKKCVKTAILKCVFKNEIYVHLCGLYVHFQCPICNKLQKSMKNKPKINTAKAYKYYCIGLNSKEIARLLNCSYRTIQNYMSTENWKQKRNNNKGD